jgi:fimbrial isopeptide formation D2 family protein
MKKTKVLASILLAVVFILSMTTSAFAATVVNNSGLEHDYFAYQVFKGTQNPNTGTLGDIDWGNGVNSVTLLAELNANNADGQTVSTADEIAKLIPTETDYEAKALSKIIYRHIISDNKIALPNSGDVNLDPGYYLIVDESDVDGKYDANNMALLQLTDTITIADKTGTPTVQKRVFEQSLDSGAGKYNDVADYSIGENIKFKFNVNLPENIENFKGTSIDQETGKSKEKGYFINLHDKMSAGLTLNEDSFVIKVDGVEVGSGIYPIIGTPDAPFEDDCTFEIGQTIFLN